MDWITGMQKAIDYIEAHLTDEDGIDYKIVAQQGFSSSYHFQRVFSILCGYTLGEYIRNRRLTLAGAELTSGKIKVIDAALKYGYESPDSFAKAFQKFHGITPSQAHDDGAVLKSFSRLVLKVSLEGGSMMDYRMEEKEEMVLTGYKVHFAGTPENRNSKQHDLMVDGNIRFVRYALQGLVQDCETEYCAIYNISEDGFDFMIGNQVPDHFLKDLSRHLGKYSKLLTVCRIPKQTYVIAETERDARAIESHLDIRKRIVSEWLSESAYCLAKGVEITVYHKPMSNHDKAYLELWIPIEKKQ